MELYIVALFFLFLTLILTVKKNEKFNQDDFIEKKVNYYYDEYDNKLNTNCTKKIISDARNNTYCKHNQKYIYITSKLYNNNNFINIKHNSIFYPAYSTKNIPFKITSPDWYHIVN